MTSEIEVVVAAALDAPVPLAFVSAFLDARELLTLRAVSHSCERLLALHVRALVGSKALDARAFPVLARCFPHVATLQLRACQLRSDALTRVLTKSVAVSWGAALRELELSALLHLTDRHLQLCVQLLPALETLVVTQCYQVKTPLLVGARLRRLSLQNGFFTQFAAGTRLPALEELHITSQVLTTLHVRHLIKSALPESGAPLRVLSLANCGAITQLFVDPMELPKLHTLDLKCCHALERVHVASRSLEALNLSMCVELQFAVLDLPSALAVDLSFLKEMTRLFLNAKALKVLNLNGCGQLERQHLHVTCPALQLAHLHGASVGLSDMNRDQEMAVPLEMLP